MPINIVARRIRYAVCLLACGCLSVVLQAQAEEIRVNPDRAAVQFGQAFTVSFSTDKADAAEPDWAPLSKDFDVMAVQRKVDGVSKIWFAQLKPKRSGSLLIPPLAFGPYTSQARPVQVHLQLAQGAPPDFFITVESAPQSPYVQAEAIVTYRFFMARSLRGNYGLPKVNGASLQPVDQGRNITQRYQGRSYTVHERKVLFRPQASGQVVINPITLKGHYQQGNVYRQANIKSPSLSVPVRGIPDNYPGRYWLPASNLELSEEKSESVWRAGQPYTRIIKMKVQGLSPQQLPALNIPPVKSMKIYTSNPQRRKLSQAVYPAVSEQTQKAVFIPSRAGQQVLPAIRVPWWNTKTDRLEYAVLAEREITVAEPEETLIAADDYSGEQAELSPLLVQEDQIWKSPWLWLSASLAVLWLATLATLLRARLRPMRERARAEKKISRAHKERLTDCRKRLQTACRNNDADAARQAINGWLTSLFPDKKLAGLSASAHQCGGDLQDEIKSLERALYANVNDWQGQPLWQAFVRQETELVQAARQQKKKAQQRGKEKQSRLLPLHKLH